MLRWVNTLRPKQNGGHFAVDIFKCIFVNENTQISPKISLKFVPKVRINNIPTLVQIMAWRRPGDKPLSEPMMVGLLKHICITRPKWVKGSHELYLAQCSLSILFWTLAKRLDKLVCAFVASGKDCYKGYIYINKIPSLTFSYLYGLNRISIQCHQLCFPSKLCTVQLFNIMSAYSSFINMGSDNQTM